MTRDELIAKGNAMTTQDKLDVLADLKSEYDALALSLQIMLDTLHRSKTDNDDVEIIEAD